MKILRIVYLLSVAIADACGQSTPVTVCQLLNGNVASGSIISVHGILDGAFHHGFFVTEGIGWEPCPGWRKTILTSPSAIPIDFSDRNNVQRTDEEKKSIEDFLHKRRSLDIQEQLVPTKVMIVAVIIKKSFPLIFRNSEGAYFGNGFGSRGGCPIILMVKSIQQIE